MNFALVSNSPHAERFVELGSQALQQDVGVKPVIGKWFSHP